MTTPRDPRQDGLDGVGRMAEIHYLIRPVLENALKERVLTDEARKFLNSTADTYHDIRVGSFNDRFFDMTTFVGLGTHVETGLRHHYLAKYAPTQPPSRGIFQRLVKPQELHDLYDQHGYDLSSNTHFARMRELVVHRHLYAHRTGLVDDQYIEDLKTVTGKDIMPDMHARRYPNEEVYWFRPLKELNDFIEDARSFFRELP